MKRENMTAAPSPQDGSGSTISTQVRVGEKEYRRRVLGGARELEHAPSFHLCIFSIKLLIKISISI